MAFPDDLFRYIDQAKARLPHIKGEEAAKHALVVPLLQVFGYDVFDPREVQPEYVADFAKKKAGQFEKIDYAVWLNGAPVMFVECKAVDAKLEDLDGQLARYFNATPSVKVGILTNGIRMRIFSDLQAPNIMDPTPWLDVDLLAPKPADVEALKRLRKADFGTEAVVSLAEEMVYYNAITAFLSSQIREPSEGFVRYVAGMIPSIPRVTTKVIDRITPIVKKSIQAVIVEHVARSFEPKPSDVPPVAAEPVPPAEELEASPLPPAVRAGVVTTDDELAFYATVAKWVGEVHPGAPIAFRDSKSYFTIHQANLRKWFMRLNVSKAPFWVAFRGVSPDELRRLAPGLDIAEPGQLGDSRVLMKQLADMEKLRASVIAAYEKESARAGDDAEAPQETLN